MNTLYVFLRVVRQFRRDPRTLALIFLAPVLVMGVFYLVFREDVTPRLRVGVHFAGAQTPFVVAVAEALGEMEPVQLTLLSHDDLARAMDELDLDAAVLFPESLQTDLARYMAMCGKPRLAEIDRSLLRVHARG